MVSFFQQLPLLSTIGLILLFGFLGSRIARRFKLPSVTGYIFAGVIVGRSVLGWIRGAPHSPLSLALDNLSVMALGIIAFDIGSELRFSKLRRTGKNVFPIALLEALGAAVVVSGVIMLLSLGTSSILIRGASFRDILPLALILGAISSATAPAATLVVINEYRTRGPVTETLLGVVAMDDGFCIMIFGIAFPMAVALAGGAGLSLSFSGVVLHPLMEIAISLGLGAAVGAFMTSILRYIPGKSSQMVLVLGFILLLCGVAAHWHLSPLLTNMAFGCMIAHFSGRSGSIVSGLESVEPPLFVAFFTIAGINLDLSLLTKIGLLGLACFASRIVGKNIGSSLGAHLSNAPRTVRRYLGLGLIPQAGVAIGLVLPVQSHPVLSHTIIGGQPLPAIVTNCVLATVALNAIIGPLAAKFALRRAGEITSEGEQ